MRPSGVEEIEDGDPMEVARQNARRKAQAVAGDPVLGVDTLVALDGRVYGKPPDGAAAAATLRALSGRTHEVISGLALRDGRDAVAVTRVTFRELDHGWIAWYLATGEWEGRAGAYAVQGRGAALVIRIDGDYLNVVGLPVGALLELIPGLISRPA